MTRRETSVRLLRARAHRGGGWVHLARAEWAAARRQAAWYIGSLILGGRVVPISIIEDAIRRGRP